VKKILVIGTGNDCRSQMMEGWLSYYCGTEAEIYSAGYRPSELNMMAVKVMMDAMIDITGHASCGIDELPCKEFDYVINMAEEQGREIIASLPDSALVIDKTSQDCRELEGDEEDILKKLAAIRDSIEDFSFDFVNENIRGLIPDDLPGQSKSVK